MVIGAVSLLTACGSLLALEPLRFDDEDAGAEDAPFAPDVTAGDVVIADRRLSDGDASSGTFCSSVAHDFCDDFEGVRTIQGQWSAFFTVGTGTAAIEAGTFIVVVRQADAAALQVSGGAFVLDRPSTLADAGGRRRSRVAFRAFVEECPLTNDPAAQLAVVGLNGKEIQLIIDRQGADCVARLREIVTVGAVYRRSTPLLVPVGQWEQYGLDLPENAAGTGGEAKLALGALDVVLPLTPTPEPDRFYGVVGVTQGSYSGTTARVRFDDVRIDYLK